MSNYEIAELTWKNGQLGMNGLLQTKSSTVWTSETLESIVHQATCLNHSGETPSSGHWPGVMKKRTRSEADYATLSVKGSNCMESETNNKSSSCWAKSFDSSSPSFNHINTTFEDSASLGGSEKENQDEDGETRTETVKSGSSRRSRAASVHNQSERRRRDRINQKMKALQKLVPNASKTDKASMLDEVIEYLKQLQAQVQVMSSARQMIMSLRMQQQHQLQMSLLAPMPMGMGIGNPTPTSFRMGMGITNPPTSSFLPPPFLLPSIIHHPPPTQQSMNIEVYNKMAQLYQQQVNQTTHMSNQ